jgi:hypothetical protein
VDDETLAQRLVEAEQRVALGDRHIAKQRARIKVLVTDGRDINKAADLLATFRETQRRHIEDRDRLKKELNNARRGPR